MSLDDFTSEQQIGLLAVAAILVGAVMPWFEASVLGTTATESGIDHNGWITGLAAIVAAAAIAIGWREIQQATVAVAGLLVTLLSAAYVIDPHVFGYEGPAELQTAAEATVTPAIGLYVTLIGGIALLFVGTIALNDSFVEGFDTGSPAKE